jgi:hypothetical protein
MKRKGGSLVRQRNGEMRQKQLNQLRCKQADKKKERKKRARRRHHLLPIRRVILSIYQDDSGRSDEARK